MNHVYIKFHLRSSKYGNGLKRNVRISLEKRNVVGRGGCGSGATKYRLKRFFGTGKGFFDVANYNENGLFWNFKLLVNMIILRNSLPNIIY